MRKLHRDGSKPSYPKGGNPLKLLGILGYEIKGGWSAKFPFGDRYAQGELH